MRTNIFKSLAMAAAMTCGTLTICAAESLLLTGATVHTVSGETLSPGQVLMKDGKIAAVGATVEGGGAKVVDLKGLHLFPGLIATDTSLGLTEISAVRATLDTTEVGAYKPEVKSWVSVNPDSELLPVARANGITHYQAVPMGGTVSGQSAVMTMSGWSTEEMTYRKPVALHLFWPDMNLNTTPRDQMRDKSKAKSLDDQAKDRTKKLKEIDEFFLEAEAYKKSRPANGTVADAGYNPTWEGMLPFLRGEIPLMIHADSVQQIKAAVKWTGERKYKIILAGGRDAHAVASLLAEKTIPVIYESVWEHPIRDAESYDVYYKAAEVLRAAGVKVIFSGGLGGKGATEIRNVPYAAAQAMAFGLPELEAVRGLTLYPAQVLGVADRLGSIETGKDATLFASDGSILDQRANVKRMWINGQEVTLDSRHTRLYEKYRNRPLPK